MDDGSQETFAFALREAISRSGLSLERIRQRLDRLGAPVSTASLSHWQSGRSRPERPNSLEAVGVLEEILGTDPDSLRDLLGAPRPRGPVSHGPDIDVFAPRSGPVRRVLDELGFETAGDFPQEMAVHMGMEVNTTESLQRIRMRILVRGVAVGPCRLPVLHRMGPDEPNEHPVVTVVEGCHVGRSVSRPEDRAFGTELVVDSITAPGEEAFVEYGVDLRADHTRSTECFYAIARRCQAILVDVRFRGPDVPRECTRFREDRQGTSSAPVHLDGTRRVHASEQSFGPGRIGLKWSWDV